jgi:catechol 2,3-dioxygenase-like lactoylglutathione lyase family enzyme
MRVDLFAGILVRDVETAAAWYEQLLGAPPSFRPNDSEAVWEVAENRYVYIEARPGTAGQSTLTLFVEDFDERIRQVAERGLEPDTRDVYENGVRKYVFRDPDGNEIGFGGAPQQPPAGVASAAVK